MKNFLQKISIFLILAVLNSVAIAASSPKKSTQNNIPKHYYRAAKGYAEVEEFDPTTIGRIASRDSENQVESEGILCIASKYNEGVTGDEQQKKLDTKNSGWFEFFGVDIVEWFKSFFGL